MTKTMSNPPTTPACAGVATWGYKVMRALGVRVTKMTNSRGFTVELCAAAVVILASRFDLPLS